jgi:NTP pyrophosphatase (non-canonical NTP hydrolase)
MDLDRLQSENAAWVSRQAFDSGDPNDPLLGLVEEVGELAHAVLKAKQGIRGTPEEHSAAARDAIGDIVIYLADFCERHGWILSHCVEDTWDKVVKKRDWAKNRETGEAQGQ